MNKSFVDTRGNILDCILLDDPQNELPQDEYVTLIEIVPWINIDGKDISCPASRLTIKDINMLNTLCS